MPEGCVPDQTGRLRRAAVRTAWVLAGLAGLAASAAQASPVPEPRPAHIHEFREIALPARPAGPRPELAIELEGRRISLVLEDNRRLLAGLPEPQRRRALAGDSRFLAGTIAGVPGSWVRLAWIDGRWSGGFFDGTELFLVESAAAVAGLTRRPVQHPGGHLVFRFSDLEIPGLLGHEPVQAGPAPAPADAKWSEFSGHLQELAQLQGAAAFSLPLTVVSDTQFNTIHDDNAGAVVAARLNFVDGIYSGQVGLGVGLLYHEPLSDDGPLTSTDPVTLLTEQFRPFMTTGGGSAIPFGGATHLFTGRNLDGNTVGIAFLGRVCNRDSGYGINQNLSNDTISALVIAHELGHNFNAPHDGQEGACQDESFQGIMRPSISQSRQEFSPCSLEQMAPTIAAAACLAESGEFDLIFSDDFGG